MDLFSDDEHFWNGNEENELISIESFDESIQSDELTSNDKSAGEETPRKNGPPLIPIFSFVLVPLDAKSILANIVFL